MRRECLDHEITFNETRLYRQLKSIAIYGLAGVVACRGQTSDQSLSTRSPTGHHRYGRRTAYDPEAGALSTASATRVLICGWFACDCCSQSITSLRRNRHCLPTLTAGISLTSAHVHTVRGAIPSHLDICSVVSMRSSKSLLVNVPSRVSPARVFTRNCFCDTSSNVTVLLELK